MNIVVTGVLLLAFVGVRHYSFQRRLQQFEIEEAELGLGDQKIILRANDLDRTVANSVWVELSTRKMA